MNDVELHREVGRHEGLISTLQGDVAEIKKDVKQILGCINQSKGGWKVMVFMCSLAGSCGAVAYKVITSLWFVPR